MRIRESIRLLTLCAALCACGGGVGTPHAGPRRLMLQDLATVVIVPTYESLASEAGAQVEAATALESDPSADTLSAAQTAWRRTRAAWKQSEAFAIGPAETLRTAARIDWSPAKPDRIESELAGTAELTDAYVEDLGANVKGFLALEYLLFDPDGGDAAVLASLGAPNGARRRAFIRALAENLRDQAIALRDAWSPDAGDFSAQLATAGQGSAAFPNVKSAVDKVVNQLIFLSEDVADAQLLAALGTRGSSGPRPDLIDAHRSENGLADLIDNLAGIQNVYYGSYRDRRGHSLSEIVDGVSPTTDGALGVVIRRTLDNAARISESLEQAVRDDPAAVERTRNSAKELMQRLEVDLVSALGSTLRFNPNDGD